MFVNANRKFGTNNFCSLRNNNENLQTVCNPVHKKKVVGVLKHFLITTDEQKSKTLLTALKHSQCARIKYVFTQKGVSQNIRITLSAGTNDIFF